MAELLKTLFKRIQDGASELGDAIHGERMERGVDNDIRTIDLHLHQVRNDAASIKALRIVREDEAKHAKAEIATMEAAIADLLSRRRNSQARTKAVDALALQDEYAVLQRECKELKDQEVEFAQLIAQIEQKLRRAKHQLGTLRAASGIQRAQAAVASLQPGPAPYPESAQASAQRARQRATKDSRDRSAKLSKPRSRSKSAGSDADGAIDALIGRLSNQSAAAATKRNSRKTK